MGLAAEVSERLVMSCAYCGDRLRWPADFPVPHYARCGRCTSEEHARSAWGVAVALLALAAVVVALLLGQP